ncbi:MAG: flagellar hook-associated protein FlgL, partial [Clostridiales bacterium]|nr:flagellar hook-associated protein FlgL [Clostridiales bacterium]
NINKNKQYLSTKGDQYATGQKIQRPSEDPVVAIRSLKYRTQLTQLNQYYEKNIPDAKQWMNVTESALTQMNSIITQMNTYFNQGANDPLTVANRDSIAMTLDEYMQQIYQYANTDYAGRYVFTGYRTDEPLVFPRDCTEYSYEITENLTKNDVMSFQYVKASLDFNASLTAEDYAKKAPTMLKGYRMNISYEQIDDMTGISYTKGGTTTGLKIKVIESGDANAYDINAYNDAAADPCDALVLKDTGEVILTKAAYQAMKEADDITTKYKKSSFDAGDAVPEHYFDCTRVTMDDTGAPVAGTEGNYTKPGQQKIQYEINFSQKLTVNTMANEFLSADLKRHVDDVIKQLNQVSNIETKISEMEKKLTDDTLSDTQKKAVTELKKQLENQLSMENKVLQEKYAHGLTVTQKAEDEVNAADADLGSRYNRLELTEDRLSNQQVDFEDMLLSNDSVELEDSIINYTSAKDQYNASLSAAAKAVTNTLLDFL